LIERATAWIDTGDVGIMIVPGDFREYDHNREACFTVDPRA
jgi:hypothetical protein